MANRWQPTRQQLLLCGLTRHAKAPPFSYSSSMKRPLQTSRPPSTSTTSSVCGGRYRVVVLSVIVTAGLCSFVIQFIDSAAYLRSFVVDLNNFSSVQASSSLDESHRVQQLTERAHELASQLAVANQKLAALQDAVPMSTVPQDASLKIPALSTENISHKELVPILESMTIEEEEALLDAVHGKEYHYRLSCPGHFDDSIHQLLQDTNSTVLIGYHVGMIKNWRFIVKDQLRTLHTCGLASVVNHIYLSYSNNATVDDELSDLNKILRRYPQIYDKTTLLYCNQQPIESASIRAVHAECQRRHPEASFPPPVNPEVMQSDTIVFYFHTKGSSRYNEDWRDHMDARFQYPTALYWRKYMEYFTIERPFVCVRKILQEGHYGCGVWWAQRKFYGGNFWAASGRYLASLQPLPVFPIKETKKRWLSEGYITEELRESNLTDFNQYIPLFVAVSNPRAGLYRYLIRPSDFSDYTARWNVP